MKGGVIGLGIWCVDTTYKINKLPERGTLESIIDSNQCVGGGPSNVLTNLSSLGFKSNLIAMGSIGKDNNSTLIKQHCRSNGIISKYLSSSPNIPTSHSLCMFEKQKERTFLYYSGANELLDIKHFKLNEIKNNPKILYVGYLSLLGKLDYFDGKETRLCKVLKEARKKNLITILDLASNNIPNFQKIIFSSLPYTDYLLLNEIEAQLLFNTSLLNSNNQLNQKLIIKLSKKAFQKGLRKALVIHSPLESLYISKDNSCHSKSIKIPKKNIKNAVGAGDAFCAGFVFGIHEEWDIETTLKKSHAAGSAMMKIDSSSGNLPNIKNL